jgi:hypothetical protein
MKRILDSFNRRGSSKSTTYAGPCWLSPDVAAGQDGHVQSVPQGDSPELTIVREVVSWTSPLALPSTDPFVVQIAFCESSAPNSPTAVSTTSLASLIFPDGLA